MAEMPTVHIVDDDRAVRLSLAQLFESDGYQVATYATPAALLLAHPELRPGCIVADLRMPEMDGLELLAELRRRGTHLPVVVLTGHADVRLAVEALRHGAADFLEKPCDDGILLAAVETAIAAAGSTSDATAFDEELGERLRSLSGQEIRVLEGMIAGKMNKTIAGDLGISSRTVEVYRAKALRKMGVANVAELVRVVLRSPRFGNGRLVEMIEHPS